MTVFVAYAHTPEGQAALERGAQISRREQLPLVVFDLEAASDAPDRSIPATVPLPDGEGLDVRWLARDARSNDATGELIDLVHTVEPDVVVVGVRPRTSVGKFLLGSNAQRIIIDSPAPVLAVKADRHEK
ncbi:universal stress protein [Promicromonospora alba]|uniref:Universal stress protein n=1 Tax=Promicromonospora alba TaxID=1616110 RepID=A0ABV9HN91_9MICO